MSQEKRAEEATKLLGLGGVSRFWKTWRRVHEEERAVSESDEGFVTRMLTAMYVLKRILPLYLLLFFCVLIIQLLFFDNLVSTIHIYGGRSSSKTGSAAEELAKTLSEDFNREAAVYRWWKWFQSEDDNLKATATSAERLGQLVADPTSLVIIQDGYRPNFADPEIQKQTWMNSELASVRSLDVRAIADLWDSYLHVFVGSDPSGKPLFSMIDTIDPNAVIYVGQGVQASMARKILCNYGVFNSDEEAKLSLDRVKDPADPELLLQAKSMAETIDAVRAGQIKVAFILTSTADVQKYFEGKRKSSGELHLLPIDRADAIAEEISFGDVGVLPWHAYQDRSVGKSKSLPDRIERNSSGESRGEKGIKTLRTQTILACSSNLADGVVTGILNAMYARTDYQHFSLHPRPPSDQKFLFPMHNASHAFHKGGPSQGYITSPFIVGGLTLILGQLLYISGQLRERKGHLREREGRRRDVESQRSIAKLKDLLEELKSDPADSTASTSAGARIDSDLHETYEQAVHDFVSGRINREGFDRIVELHRLSRRILERRDSGTESL